MRISNTDQTMEKIYKGPGKREHIVADTLLPTQMFPRLPARNICYGHKFCVRDTKNVTDFVQKHFVAATNVFRFAQHGNTTFILCRARLRAQETSSATMCPQQCVLVCQGLKREFLRGPRERKKMWHMLWNLKTFIFRSMITYHEPINVGVFFCSNLFFISRKSTKTVTAAIRREIGRN